MSSIGFGVSQALEMGGKARIGLGDQRTIEAVLTDTRFIPGDEQDCPSPRIKCIRDTPGAPCCRKRKLLHVGMHRAIQRIGEWPTQLRAKLLEKSDRRKQRILYIPCLRLVLFVELI